MANKIRRITTRTVLALSWVSVASVCWAQDATVLPANGPYAARQERVSEPHKVWVLSPRTANDLREQALRNQMSVQFIEPSYTASGEPNFRKISVNCFEPSVSIQYIENRRSYTGVYLYENGWNEEQTGTRRLPVDIEPSTDELRFYLQKACSEQRYP